MIKKAISFGIVGLFVIGGLVGLFSIVPDEVEGPGPTYLSGIISSDTTWIIADSPYILNGHVLVEENVNLTIEPGVEVRFDTDIYLLIHGTLYAVGEENDRILFTSNSTSPTPGDWDSIRFTSTCGYCLFKYCIIEYGMQTIDSDGADIDIINCIFRFNDNISIRMLNGNHIIINNLFTDNVEGIRIKYCPNEAKVFNNTFKNNSQWGLLVEEAPVNISNNRFINNDGGAKCMADVAQVHNNLFSCNKIGFSLEGEDGNITNNVMINNEDYGVEMSAFYGLFMHNNVTGNGYGLFVDLHGYGYLMDATIKNNNILKSVYYSVYMTYDHDVIFQDNWWDTNDPVMINDSIHDYYDDFDLGKVIYKPFLNGPDPNVPEAPWCGDSGLQPNAPWPMFRGNVRHTGLSPYDTNGNNGELKWSFPTGFRILSSPIISSDGTIYITSGDFKLYAIHPNGTEKWNFPTGWHAYTTPAIGTDGTIYFISSDNRTYAINSDGSEKWNLPMDRGGRSSPAIGSDGTIYMGSYDNNLYAINLNGTEKWNFTTGNYVSSSPAIGSDGTIYIGSHDNKLYAINPDGTEKWNFTTGDTIESSPAIGSDGTIYIGSRDYKIYAIHPNGTQYWSYTTGWHIGSSAAIGSDGTIYIGSYDNKLYAINPNGTQKWNFMTGQEIESSPAIGSDGTIYVGSSDNKLYAINPNGTEKWSYGTGADVESSPAIGSDGTIYVGSRDYYLYAIGTHLLNRPPTNPSTPSGPTSGLTNISYSFIISTTDPDGDQIKYGWDWDGDGTVDEWSGLVDSGTPDTRSHSWSTPGVYNITVKAQDEQGSESGWSGVHSITIVYPEEGKGLQEGAPWPMFNYDEKHSGLSPFDTSSNNGEMKWSFQTGGVVLSSPAIDTDGIIYFGSGDYYFYALYPNGTEKWSFPTGGRVISSPAIGADGTIYVGSEDDKLYGINPDGSEKWSFITGNDIRMAPVIGSDGTIYIGSRDNKLYAINPNGTEKWHFTAGAAIMSSPAIDSNGIIYFHSEENTLYAIYPSGTEKWRYVLGGYWEGHPSPSIGSDDTIYIASDDNNLYAINPDGTKKWNFTLHGKAELAPAIDSDGTIYVGSDNKFGLIDKLYAINPDGTEKWNTYIPGSPVYSSPSIDSNGIIYIGSGGKLYSIYPNNTERWNFEGSGQIEASPVIGSDGTIYVGFANGNLYALGTTTPNQPPNTPSSPSGPTSGLTNTSYSFSTSTTDPDGDQIKYGWDWDGDGTVDEWSNLVDSGIENNRSHNWSFPGIYHVKVKAQDEHGAESNWSDALIISITLEEPDFDEDGIPDSEDPDDDNDGYNDENDYYPLDPIRWSPLTQISILNITASNESPPEGDEITINVEIENSDTRENHIKIIFYLGDPNQGGIQIGTSHEGNIGSDSTLTFAQNWIATSGNHNIYVVIGHNDTNDTISSSIQIEVGEDILPVLVLSLGDINIYRFEPGEERTIFVEVTCYNKPLNNVHLVVLDNQNLTIDSTITPPRTMLEGETTKFYLRIKVPQLPEGKEKMEWDITIQAVGEGEISSNSEELDIVVSKDAISFFNPVILAGAVATGSLATLGAAAAASRRNENWKYLLLLSFAVPLYTRIHGKKTLDNFVRGQVFGHIQSKPGTHFNDIKKTLQLGNGNLAYHLQKLEKEGFIKSSRDKRYRRFYPIGVTVPEEDGIKLSKTQESILDYIEQHPHSNQKEIAENLKESQQTISYNINVLVREGFMQEEKIKGIKKYKLIDDNT